MASQNTLQAALDYQFGDASLLEQALTHRSHSGPHNERLEFLGDSVLNFVVASLLFVRFPKIDEGDLSRLRANLVKQAALADIAGDRKSVVQGKRVSVRVDLGGLRIINNTNVIHIPSPP